MNYVSVCENFSNSGLQKKNESSRINIASMLLKTIGEGKDAEWWLNLKPNEDSITFENWNNTLYLLRRRKWQKSN
jgi:hypothetical protein